MIEIATLVLAAAALVLAFAALRKSNAAASQEAGAARDAQLRQELSELRTATESLPGRIADEIAASPLREALEGVRESITRTSETLDEHVVRVGQGFAAGSAAMQDALDRGFRSAGAGLEAVRAATESVAASARSTDPGKGFASLEGAMRDLLKAADEHADAREKSLEAGLRKIELSLLPVVDSIGRLTGRVDALPEAFDPRQAKLEAAIATVSGSVAELAVAVREASDARSSDAGLADSVAKAQEESSAKVVEALRGQSLSLDRIASAVDGQSGESDRVVAAVQALGAELSRSAKIAEEASLPVLEGLETLSRELRETLSVLPTQIAEASANHARPMPELEELAIAVRESGHMRGDASRAVAEAVSRVGQELSEKSEAASEAREQSAAALREALERLESFASGIETRLAPLSDALKGHGEAVGPIAGGLVLAQDRLEEAAASLRANQVEFAASVALFTQAAQELSGGLSLFAREGDRQGAEDPRAAQKALLESLDRLMTGFAESLKALLTESDLRTREVLAEIAARLPAGEGG